MRRAATARTVALAPDDPIASYVSALADVLPGPRRTRADLLTELADGLHDAAVAHTRAGLSSREARALAVEESGPVAEVAPGFRAELVAAQSRRTAMLFALSLPAMVLGWTVAWSAVPPTPPAALPDGATRVAVGVLSQVTDWSGVAGGVSAVLTIGLLMWAGRLRRSVGPVIALQAGVGALAVVVSLGCSTAMVLLNPQQVARVVEASALVLPLGVVTFALTGWQLASLWRTYRVAFG